MNARTYSFSTSTFAWFRVDRRSVMNVASHLSNQGVQSLDVDGATFSVGRGASMAAPTLHHAEQFTLATSLAPRRSTIIGVGPSPSPARHWVDVWVAVPANWPNGPH